MARPRRCQDGARPGEPRGGRRGQEQLEGGESQRVDDAIVAGLYEKQ